MRNQLEFENDVSFVSFRKMFTRWNVDRRFELDVVFYLWIRIEFSFSIAHRTSIESFQTKVKIERGPSINENFVVFLFSIRQLQNGSTSMATINDSVRIASMAKRRKSKTKQSKSLTIRSSFQIELELNPSTKDFIDHIHNGYLKYLKVSENRFVSFFPWKSVEINRWTNRFIFTSIFEIQ